MCIRAANLLRFIFERVFQHSVRSSQLAYGSRTNEFQTILLRIRLKWIRFSISHTTSFRRRLILRASIAAAK